MVFGERVPLEVDPSMFVVSTTITDAASLRSRIASKGLTVRRLESFGPGNHWRVEVASLHGADAARAAASMLRRDPDIEFAEPAYRGGPQRELFWLVNGLSVRFPGVVISDGALGTFMGRHGLRLLSPPRPDSGFLNYYFAYPPGTAGRALAVAARVEADPAVQWASPDKEGQWRTGSIPTDPYYPLQFHLRSNAVYPYNGVPVDINVEPTWTHAKGAGIRFAVLDDGMDIQQIDLIGGPDGGPTNGSVAWDAVNADSPRCENSDPYHPMVYIPFPDTGAALNGDLHGTAIAGILGAQHNAIGGAGIAPHATINVVRISCRTNVALGTWASDKQIADGITWAVTFGGSDVLNLSWGRTYQSDDIMQAINTVTTTGRGGKGAVVVAASGNERPVGNIWFPAWMPNVIAVGALQPDGFIASYSSGGDQLDLHVRVESGEECRGFPGDTVVA